jgi:carnitine O-acetyltransferase
MSLNNLQIQNSKLRHRPIPNLKDSIKSYLKFIKPFTEHRSELEDSEKKMRDFQEKGGLLLQKRLLERNKVLLSWFNDYWFENFYLSQKSPIPVNWNYYMLYDFQFKDQIDAVAKIIMCSLVMKNLIKANNLTQITNKCTSQYYLLFHSARIPTDKERDKLIYDYVENKYVIILYRNVFWMLEATLDYEKIVDQVSYITSMDLSQNRENFIGILTMDDRKRWHVNREKFIQISIKNKDFIFHLERCMLFFSLEEEASTNMSLKELDKKCWYGDGQNKYFDKVLQFIIFREGTVAMNVQRSGLDHSVCSEFAKFIKQLCEHSETLISVSEKNINYFENFSFKPVKMNYDLDDELKLRIKEVSFSVSNKTQIKTDFLLFKEFGRSIIERKGLNVNSFIQLSLIATYYRVFGKIVPSRMFICGRSFMHGCEEWVRTTTKETSNFSITMSEMKVPRDLKIKFGHDSFKTQKNNTQEVLNGKSIDAHFIGLQSVIREGEKIPQIFEDEFFKKSSQWIIDTYPLNSDFLKLASNPPYNKEGISVTHIAKKDDLHFMISSYKDIGKFIQILNEVLREMKDLFIEKERDYLRPKF